MSGIGPEAYWFGDQPVAPEAKAGRVRQVFDTVARRYDLMNDLMSGGLHRLWKDRFVALMEPRADRQLLDVAGGTGDIACRWLAAAGPGARVLVADINAQMLAVGRDRAIDRGFVAGLDWVVGDAERLPLPDRAVDVVSIAFGLRNVTRIDAALAELRRVLRPGGRFWCLEFTRVPNPLVRFGYERWSAAVIPRLGALVAQDRDSYRYLVESIRRFPAAPELAERMVAAGFERVGYRHLAPGVVAIHHGRRL